MGIMNAYRERYCIDSGICIQVDQGYRLNISGAIGLGWHDFEVSELGFPFRWSELGKATIELPVMMAGYYVLYIYWRKGLANNAAFCVNTLNGGRVVNTELVVDGEIKVTRCQIALAVPDWICVDIDIDMDHRVDRLNSDLRDLGIMLGDVYIRRSSFF